MSTKIFGDLEVKADLEVKEDLTVQKTVSIPAETGERALIIDADHKVRSSSVTAEQLGRLEGVTSNIQNQLDSKASSSDMNTRLAAKADLVGGQIPTSQLPALAITDTYVVASEADMLALSAQKGDVAIRTDQKKSYIYDGAMWKELLTPTDTVLSVNGKADIVVLTTSDIEEGELHQYFTPERARTAAVQDAINATETAKAPSQKAVKDALDLKANSSDMTTALDGKVDKTTYNADMPLKADISYVNTQVGTKVSKTDISIDSAFIAPLDTKVPSQKAVKSALDLKADKTYVDDHKNDITNPHGVSKSQVGLGDVDNVKQLPMSYLDTDSTFAANSDNKVPSQKAVKAAISSLNTSFASLTNTNEDGRIDELERRANDTDTALQDLTHEVNGSDTGRVGVLESEVGSAKNRLETLESFKSDLVTSSGSPGRVQVLESSLASEINVDRNAAISTAITNNNTSVITPLQNEVSNKLDKVNGGIVTGNTIFIGSIDVPAPSQNAHAATKKYVDDKDSAINTRIDNVLSNIDETALNSLSELVTAYQAKDQELGGAIESLAGAKLNKTGGTMTGDITMSQGSKVTGLPTPSASSDAATMGWVQSELSSKFDKSGGTISGATAFSNTTTFNAGVNFNGAINAGGKVIESVGSPVVDSDAATKGYVDTELAKKDHASEISISEISGMSATKVQGALEQLKGITSNLSNDKFDKSGGTITGAVSIWAPLSAEGLNVNLFKITSVGAPSEDSDAATKGYVDTELAKKDQASEISFAAGDTGLGLNVQGAIIAVNTKAEAIKSGDSAIAYAHPEDALSATTVAQALTELANEKFDKAGGNITGPTNIYAELNMQGNKVTGLHIGSAHNDAATYGQLNQVAISPVLTPDLTEVCSFDTAYYGGGMVDYLMKETTTNLTKVGKLMVVHNGGSIVEISDIGTETADSGITFSAAIEDGYIKIRCSVPVGQSYSMNAEKKPLGKPF